MVLCYSDLIVLGAILAWLGTQYYRRRYNTGRPPYPPGPKGLPIIGNALDMLKSQEWLKAAEWRKTYGDVVFIKIFGQSMVFLNSYEVAVELLEKRSATYSSRHETVMLSELQGWNWLPSFMPYGDRWRRHRAYLHRFLEPTSIVKYEYPQAQVAHKLLDNLLQTPNDFFRHIRNSVSATIMMVTYGHEIEGDDDPYVVLAEKGMRVASDAAVPGTFLVDNLPWLKHIPAWFPGAGFQKIAKEGYALSQDVRKIPYEASKMKILDGSTRLSMLSDLLETNTEVNGNIKNEDVIANVTGVSYAAGAETTISILQTFILAMVLYPDAQKRAQEEIDRVVGLDRLPTFEDKPNLPYIEALCKESLRWQPVAPLGIPHALTQDDVYEGYLIPQGTIVIANQWLLLHDPEEYPDPEVFNPERFLRFDENGAPKIVARDPSSVAFGFGRRICPGRHLALNSLFITISSILATFDIRRAIGEDGRPRDPGVEYTCTFLNLPKPFKCSLAPRTPLSESLIRLTVNSELDS